MWRARLRGVTPGFSLSLSPDGDFLAVTIGCRRDKDAQPSGVVRLLDLSGRASPRVIVGGQGLIVPRTLSWSGPSGELTFVRWNTEDLQGEVWAVAPLSDTKELLLSEPENGPWVHSAALSPCGDWLAITRDVRAPERPQDLRTEVSLLRREDGHRLGAWLVSRLPPPVGLRWSARPSRLFFVMADEQEVDSVAVVEVQAEGEVTVQEIETVSSLTHVLPAPRGHVAACIRYSPSRENEITLVDVGTSRAVDLARRAGGNRPTWSPDGKFIAFNTPERQLCVLELSGSTTHRIADDVLYVVAGSAWTTAGEILFTRLRERPDLPSAIDLWSVKSDGSNERRVLDDNALVGSGCGCRGPVRPQSLLLR